VTARQYMQLYEKMLQRPLIAQQAPSSAARGSIQAGSPRDQLDT
jgi:hypothetical protein